MAEKGIDWLKKKIGMDVKEGDTKAEYDRSLSHRENVERFKEEHPEARGSAFRYGSKPTKFEEQEMEQQLMEHNAYQNANEAKWRRVHGGDIPRRVPMFGQNPEAELARRAAREEEARIASEETASRTSEENRERKKILGIIPNPVGDFNMGWTSPEERRAKFAFEQSENVIGTPLKPRMSPVGTLPSDMDKSSQTTYESWFKPVMGHGKNIIGRKAPYDEKSGINIFGKGTVTKYLGKGSEIVGKAIDTYAPSLEQQEAQMLKKHKTQRDYIENLRNTGQISEEQARIMNKQLGKTQTREIEKVTSEKLKRAFMSPEQKLIYNVQQAYQNVGGRTIKHPGGGKPIYAAKGYSKYYRSGKYIKPTRTYTRTDPKTGMKIKVTRTNPAYIREYGMTPEGKPATPQEMAKAQALGRFAPRKYRMGVEPSQAAMAQPVGRRAYSLIWDNTPALASGMTTGQMQIQQQGAPVQAQSSGRPSWIDSFHAGISNVENGGNGGAPRYNPLTGGTQSGNLLVGGFGGSMMQPQQERYNPLKDAVMKVQSRNAMQPSQLGGSIGGGMMGGFSGAMLMQPAQERYNPLKDAVMKVQAGRRRSFW